MFAEEGGKTFSFPGEKKEPSAWAEEQDTLDPADWKDFRAQGHRMLDDMLDYIEHIRERPVWQPIPPEVRNAFREALPRQPGDLAEAQALQEVEARIEAETEVLEAAEAKSRAESAAALQARKGADALIRAARAITRGARRALLLKRVALAGAMLAAMAWLGSSWYRESPAASPAVAASTVAPVPILIDGQVSAADAGFTLKLKISDALQQRPAER